MTDCAAPRHGEPEPAAPSAFLCHGCARGLRRDLTILPELYVRLAELLAPARAAGGGGSGDGLPYHDPASECRSQIRKDLRFWANWIIEVRQPPAWPVLTIPAMAGWLAGYASWVPLWEHAGEMAGAFAANRGRARALLDPRPVASFRFDDCPRCETGVLRASIPKSDGDRRPPLITCDGCGHEWDTTQWLGLGKTILARKAAA